MRFSLSKSAQSVSATLGLGLLLITQAQADIHYVVKVEPSKKTFAVTVDLAATSEATIFRIPAWSPGYYKLASYEKQISGVEARDDFGTPMPIQRVDSHSWKVSSTAGKKLHFSYRVLASDEGLGFFGAMLSSRVGFINGASTFMYVDQRKTEPSSVNVQLPTGWDIETSLDKDSSGRYAAESGYDELIDAPIQVGTMLRVKFAVEGIPFEAVYVTNGAKIACDPKVEAERLRIVSAPAIQLFRGAGFKHYIYIIHLDPGNFQGGLEHRASTCIEIPNDPHLNLDDLAAHENFHAWNVKQIRPFVLGPFDYTGPVRTGNLWWMEGVTDYYSKILTYRSGLHGSDWLFSQITEQVSELQRANNRLTVTLEECSRNCWENDGFGVGDLSFYTKGFLVGFILDAEIRSATQGKKSLDDVERLLFERYRLPQPGLKEDGIEQAIAEVVGSHQLDDLYNRMLRTTDELPYQSLKKMGLQLQVEGAPYVVAAWTANKGIVVQVSGPAQDAGLRVGDKILSISGETVGADGTPSPMETVEIERGGVRQTLQVPILTKQGDHFEVMIDPAASSEAAGYRSDWLKLHP